jgi:hypothetical protein
MACTKTKTAIVVGVGLLLIAGIVTLIVFRHAIEHSLTLASGRRAIANHIAAPLDLTANYGTPASYFDKITQFPVWRTVPRGFQVFAHVPLEIGGMICLWGEINAKRMNLVFPEQVLGIAVNQKFQTLYVYHGAFFASPKSTPVCDVVFRYEDGSSATNQLLYGGDILEWGAGKPGKPVIAPSSARSKLAWVGGSFTPDKPKAKSQVRFCLTAIANPQPSIEVTSIDLYSCKSLSTACIMAMTTGRSGLLK